VILEHYGYVAYNHQLDEIVTASNIEESIKMLTDTASKVIDHLEDNGEYIL
jgi:hypothetical protein